MLRIHKGLSPRVTQQQQQTKIVKSLLPTRLLICSVKLTLKYSKCSKRKLNLLITERLMTSWKNGRKKRWDRKRVNKGTATRIANSQAKLSNRLGNPGDRERKERNRICLDLITQLICWGNVMTYYGPTKRFSL